jgi:hypothetical protein
MMRRLPTWILVGAVALLVAVAAADALRPGPTTKPTKGGPVRATDLSGVLVAAGADCSVRAIRLQDHAEQALARPVDCDGAVWSRDRTLNASCARDVTTVTAREPGFIFRFDGCSPAWRPDGAVSFIHDGNLLVARRRGRAQVFLARGEIKSSLAGEFPGAEGYELVEVAWHEPQSFAGIVAPSGPGPRAVVVSTPEETRLVVPPTRGLANVRVSPLGNVAFLREGAFAMVDPAGEDIPLPTIHPAQAITWSDDEAWVAIATRTTTFIAKTGTRRVVMRIPIGGETIEWLRFDRR